MAVDSDGIVVAGSTNYEIERSTDGGKTFSADISNSHTMDIFTIVWGNGVFIAGGQGGEISRSTDAGVTWSSLISNAFDTGNEDVLGGAFDPISKTFVMVGNSSTVALRSTDNGVTWVAPTTPPSGVTQMDSVVCTGANTFVALSRAGDVYVSTDAGDTWSSAVQVGPTDGMVGICIAYTNEVILVALRNTGSTAYYLYRSVNNGTTWTSVPWTTTDVVGGDICGAGGFFFVADTISVDGARTFVTGYSGQTTNAPATVQSCVWNPVYRHFVINASHYSPYMEAGSGIVESGSDEYGYYRKFSDGTMMQWSGPLTWPENGTLAANWFGSTAGNMYYYDDTWTFPEPFADASKVAIWGWGGAGLAAAAYWVSGTPSTTSCRVRCFHPDSTRSGTSNIQVYEFGGCAIGTWK